MTMNRYESYKDSGIPWLGEVPAHWEVKRLKFLAKIQNGADYKHVETNEGYPVIGSGGQFAYACDYLYKGKSVLLGRKGTIDKPLYVDDAFWTVDTMYYTEIFKNTHPKFFYYLVLTVDFKKYSTQTALPSMTQTVLNNLIFAVPAYKEQTAIADYLDNKLGEIDALISKQETLLEKLAEQRTAMITHAVTKGLNAHAPMKNSGVAWLGDVPEHWRVIKLGHALLNLRTGLNPRSNFELNTSDAENYYVTIQELVNDSIKFTDNTDKINDEALKIINNRSVLKIGDILLSGTGTIGKTALISETPKNWNIKEGVYALTPNLNSVSSSFLLRLFHAKYLLNQMDTLAMGSTVRSVKMADLKFIKIALPPLPEQTAIANYLDEQTAKIDRLSDTVNQTIASLKEYRSALITQAVTGKIKVV